MIYARHGDLRFDTVSSLPEGEEIKYSDVIILAEGEFSGHSHKLLTKTAKAVRHNGAIYFQVKEITPLQHEEHKTIEFVPGIYRMVFEVDYNPLKRALSQAKD